MTSDKTRCFHEANSNFAYMTTNHQTDKGCVRIYLLFGNHLGHPGTGTPENDQIIQKALETGSRPLFFSQVKEAGRDIFSKRKRDLESNVLVT